MSNSGKCLFEPLKPGTLPGKRHFLHHIAMKIIAGRIDLARV